MSTQYSMFHPFVRLPKELREKIWTYCLPYRVFEADYPVATEVFQAVSLDGPIECRLQATTYMNGRPPTITRVCRESRQLAFKTGRMDDGLLVGNCPDDPWDSYTRHNPGAVWEDRARDMAHMPWASLAEANFPTWGNPLPYIATKASSLTGTGSIMIQHIDEWFGDSRFNSDDDVDHDGTGRQTIPGPPVQQLPPLEPAVEKDLKTLLRVQEWLVVMRVVVIHCDHTTAATTPLFGLLGDALVRRRRCS